MIHLIQLQFKKRIYDEGMVRISGILDDLSHEEIWYSPNSNMNSIGNLVLHLNGNVTQWIGTGVGKHPDVRQRDLEFSSKGTHSADELKELMSSLKALTEPIIDKLTYEQLSQPQTVQGYEETVGSIIIHVIEHFSYHVGQIAFMAKLLQDRDLGFYADVDLTVIG